MNDSRGRNLLPRLKGAGIAQGTLGGWSTTSSPEELAKLDFGEYEEQGLRTRIQSIPSPWARLLLFRAALEDASHPAHDLVANEVLDGFEFLWSSQARSGSEIQWQPVRLSDLRLLAEQTQSIRSGDFAAALIELAPKSEGNGGAAIDLISIGMVGDRPVLASSPFTGIFTAEDAAGEGTGTFFRYAADGVLRSLAERRKSFQQYLAEVILPQLNENTPLAPGEHREWLTLRRILGPWVRKEVARAGLSTGGADFRGAAERMSLEPFDAPFGGLLLFHRRAGGELEHSRWRVQSSLARETAPLVLDSSSFDGEYYEGATRVKVVDLAAQDRTVLPGLGERYPWVHPATDWLSEKVLLLNEPLKPESVIGLDGYQWRGAATDTRFSTPRMTLPLKADFFRFFEPEDVPGMLKIQVQPAGDIEVSLTVPVGTDGQSDKVVIRRSYPSTQREEPGPGLAIWPAFESETWNNYVVFRQDASASFADYVEMVPLNRQGERLSGAPVRRTELVAATPLDHAPAVLEFRSTLGRGSTSMGVVLPRYRPVAPRSSSAWHVGVDFGTSNTVIAIRRSGSTETQLFEAEDQILSLTEPAETTQPIMDAYFFPEEVAARPFGTAVVHLIDRPDVHFSQEKVGARVTVPFHGHVYEETRNRIVGDLKWSADRDAFYLSSSFLRHTLSSVLAAAIQEGVEPSQVTISWAYPRAFTPAQRSHLESQWEEVVRALSDTGLRSDAVRESLDESRSVLRHFFNLGEVHVVGEAQAVLDVGGGTTDIAAYGEGRVLLLDSVMLGGRNLTGPALRPATMPERVNPFVVAFYVWASKNHLPQTEKEVFAAYMKAGHIHLAFSYLVGTRWFREGRAAQFAATKEFQNFQLIVLYTFGALLHYLGLSFRGLASKEDSDDVRLPQAVVIAGNGSRYLNWLVNLRPVEKEVGLLDSLGRLLALAAGAGDGPLPRIRVSPQPKHEVARGLVAETETGVIDESIYTSGSLIGESVRLRGSEFGATDRLKADDVINGGDVAKLEWLSDETEIERFHRNLIIVAEGLKPYGGVWTNAARQYKDALSEFQRRDLRQEAVGRIGFLAQKQGGFHGSIFILEAATVVEGLLQKLFPEVRR